LRGVLILLLGLALLGLAACGPTAAPGATPIVTPGAATPAPSDQAPAPSDQAPAPVGTQGGAPAAVPTGGMAPPAVPTGGAVPPAVPTGGADPGPVSGAPAPNPEEPPRISVEELKKLMDAGSVLLIDVRSEAIYGMRHIAGAVSAPFEDIERQARILPKDKLIVAYCQ
jgi:hypothetical protein